MINGGIFFALLITEILIGMYAHGFVREYIGDVLVMPAMYFLIRIFTDKFPRALPLILFVFACGVEVSQYFELYRHLGLEKGSLPAIIMGTGFAWGDIAAYAAGTLINAAAGAIRNKKNHPVP